MSPHPFSEIIPTARRATVVVSAVLTLGCYPKSSDMIDSMLTATPPSSSTASMGEALRRLSQRQIYFGHQSVGSNLMAGVEQILNENGDVGLKLVETHGTERISGPAFVHFAVGRNEDPESKNAAFLSVLDARPTRDSAIALMKYCYIDVNAGTDIDALFRSYRGLVAEVKRRHSDVTLVHVTMPLTTDAAGPKATIKRLLGRTTARELNLKRSHFNDLMRQEFAREPLFDLAALEAARPDGTVERVTVGGHTVMALAREYTSDGGHLNKTAERRFASELLSLLASVPAHRNQ